MSWKRGRLFEGGVYKIIREKNGAFIRRGRLYNNTRKKWGVYSREAFSRGRAFIRSNTVRQCCVMPLSGKNFLEQNNLFAPY